MGNFCGGRDYLYISVLDINYYDNKIELRAIKYNKNGYASSDWYQIRKSDIKWKEMTKMLVTNKKLNISNINNLKPFNTKLESLKTYLKRIESYLSTLCVTVNDVGGYNGVSTYVQYDIVEVVD